MSLHDMLLKAIQEGDTRKFETLLDRLKKRSDKNKANSLQYIMHHLSSYISEKTRPHLLQFLSRLFQEGASPNRSSTKYYPEHPLKDILYALNDDPELCASVTELFIQNGLDLTDPNPMYVAVGCCLPRAVQKLLDAGYDPNKAVRFRSSAVRFRSSAQPSYILSKAVSEMGCWSTRSDSASMYHRAEEVVRVLLKSGADPNLSIDDPGGLPAIFYCNKPDTVQLLLEHGANINAQETAGRSMLHMSIIDGDIDMAEYLLEHGANPNLQDNYGCGPIFYVQSAEAIRLLADHGAKLNTIANNGDMPLARLCSDLIPVLIEAGAGVNFRNREGRTALYLRCRNVTSKTSACVRALIQEGADLNIRDSSGMTPFLTFMLSHSWDPYVLQHWIELAEFMVEQGADIYAKDSSGRSILNIKAPIIVAHLKEIYDHVRTRKEVLEEDIDTFAR